MKRIDDIIFNKFVCNTLSQSDMVEVEKQLIESKEIPASLHASILNYEMNTEEASEMLGVNEEQSDFINQEKNMVDEDRKEESDDSIEVQDEIITFKNSTNMNINLTKEEALKVQELSTVYNEFENSELNIDENLVNFYLAQRPGAFAEDAHEVIAGIRKGVETFNANLTAALKDGDIDYISQLKELGQDLTNEQKFELYINFLSALHVLNVQNFSAEKASQIEDFVTIKQGFAPTGEITDEMLDEVIGKIADALNNNTLCMTSIDKMRDLMEVLPDGSEAVKEELCGSENDMHTKLVNALAIYIAYQNEDITSLKGQNVSPEAIAIAAAAGIEQAHVIEDTRTGKITVEKAIKVLKIIGGVALWTTLMAGVIYVAVNLAMFTMGSFIGLLGTSIFAMIIAGGIAAMVGIGFSNSLFDTVDSIVDGAGTIFDKIVILWRETVWPVIKDRAEAFISWIRSLLSNKTVEQTAEISPITLVTTQA